MQDKDLKEKLFNSFYLLSRNESDMLEFLLAEYKISRDELEKLYTEYLSHDISKRENIHTPKKIEKKVTTPSTSTKGMSVPLNIEGSNQNITINIINNKIK